MPILKHWKGQFLIAVAFASLAGCGRGSSAYNYIKDLHYSQWNSFASTLPIEQRLDLHKEIMGRSGHNPKMTIVVSFSDDPEGTYKALIKRMKSGGKIRDYLGILYVIDRSGSFRLCNQPDRKIIQELLAGIASYPGHEKYRPDFYDC